MKASIHFEQLLVILDDLDFMFNAGQMEWEKYHSEWMTVLEAAGYTVEEYMDAIDRRWVERPRPARPFALA